MEKCRHLMSAPRKKHYELNSEILTLCPFCRNMNFEGVGRTSKYKFPSQLPVPGGERPLFLVEGNGNQWEAQKCFDENPYISELESLESGEIQSVGDISPTKTVDMMEPEHGLITYPHMARSSLYQNFDKGDQNVVTSTSYPRVEVVAYPKLKREGYGETGGVSTPFLIEPTQVAGGFWAEEEKRKEVTPHKDRPSTRNTSISPYCGTGRRGHKRRSRSRSPLRKQSRSRSPRGSHSKSRRPSHRYSRVDSKNGGKLKGGHYHKRRTSNHHSPARMEKRNSRSQEKRVQSDRKPVVIQQLKCPHCKFVSDTFKGYHDHLNEVKHQLAMKEVFTQLMDMLKDLRAQAREDADFAQTQTDNFCPSCQLYYRTQSVKEHFFSKTHKTIAGFLRPRCKTCNSSSQSFMDHEEHICELRHIKRKAKLKGVELLLKDHSKEADNEVEREKLKLEFEKKYQKWERDLMFNLKQQQNQNLVTVDRRGSIDLLSAAGSSSESWSEEKKETRGKGEKRKPREEKLVKQPENKIALNKQKSVCAKTNWANKFKRIQQQKLILEKQQKQNGDKEEIEDDKDEMQIELNKETTTNPPILDQMDKLTKESKSVEEILSNNQYKDVKRTMSQPSCCTEEKTPTDMAQNALEVVKPESFEAQNELEALKPESFEAQIELKAIKPVSLEAQNELEAIKSVTLEAQNELEAVKPEVEISEENTGTKVKREKNKKPLTEREKVIASLKFVKKMLKGGLKGNLLEKNPDLKKAACNIELKVKSNSESDIGSEYCELIDTYYCELCKMYLPHTGNLEKIKTKHCVSPQHLKKYMRVMKLQHRKLYLERIKRQTNEEEMRKQTKEPIQEINTEAD